MLVYLNDLRHAAVIISIVALDVEVGMVANATGCKQSNVKILATFIKRLS